MMKEVLYPWSKVMRICLPMSKYEILIQYIDFKFYLLHDEALIIWWICHKFMMHRHISTHIQV